MEDTDEIATGSTVKIKLVTGRAEDAMLIPVDAVYYNGGEAYVYVYRDGTANMTAVEIGLNDSDYAEVLSGLSEDDLVISTWSSNLYEGAAVRLREDMAAESAGDETPAAEQEG